MIDLIGNNDRSEGWREKEKRSAIVLGARERRTSAARRLALLAACSSPERRGITQSSAGRYFIFADRLQRPVHSRGIVAGISMHNKRAVSPAPWLTLLASFLRVEKGGACLPPYSPEGLGSLFSSLRRASSAPNRPAVPSSSSSFPLAFRKLPLSPFVDFLLLLGTRRA